MAHFDEALKLTHASCTPEALKFYEEFQKHLARDRVGAKRTETVEAIYR